MNNFDKTYNKIIKSLALEARQFGDEDEYIPFTIKAPYGEGRPTVSRIFILLKCGLKKYISNSNTLSKSKMTGLEVAFVKPGVYITYSQSAGGRCTETFDERWIRRIASTVDKCDIELNDCSESMKQFFNSATWIEEPRKIFDENKGIGNERTRRQMLLDWGDGIKSTLDNLFKKEYDTNPAMKNAIDKALNERLGYRVQELNQNEAEKNRKSNWLPSDTEPEIVDSDNDEVEISIGHYAKGNDGKTYKLVGILYDVSENEIEEVRYEDVPSGEEHSIDKQEADEMGLFNDGYYSKLENWIEDNLY